MANFWKLPFIIIPILSLFLETIISENDPLLSRRPILEALHIDPASGVSPDTDRNPKLTKPSLGSSSGLAKLTKPSGSGKPQGEKKETPQERLKRIMSKQLNKQIKKDTAAEMAKKRQQEKQRLEKLAETNRYRHRSRSRSFSPSPPRRYRRSRSPSRGRSSRRYHSRSRSRSRSRSVSPVRAHSRSRSPRVRSRSRSKY